jgi:hypothetical protein
LRLLAIEIRLREAVSLLVECLHECTPRFFVMARYNRTNECFHLMFWPGYGAWADMDWLSPKPLVDISVVTATRASATVENFVEAAKPSVAGSHWHLLVCRGTTR